MNTATTDRKQEQIQMFGVTTEELNELYSNDLRSPQFIAMSILSDVQEMIERGYKEEARQAINRVKWIINTKTRG